MAWVDVEGHRLEYEIYPGAQPTTVLLHEGLGSVSMWKDFPQQMTNGTGRSVLAYSRWGYGRSDPRPLPWPLSYLDDAAERLPVLLDDLGIEDHVLWGHSDGGTIALMNAARNPRPGLCGVVVAAAHVHGDDPDARRGIRSALTRYREGTLRLDRHHDDPEGPLHGWADSWLDPGFAGWNLSSELPKIEVPVMVIQGEADQYGSQADIIAHGLGTDPHYLLGVGHHPHLEIPETVIELTREFITNL